MKSRFVRVIAAGLAVFALAIGTSAVGDQPATQALQAGDTSWG
ncbi:hypothetical protein GCM10011584_14490 [Nocardioides phosphati]|uniref:Uncharacterized protein n=1 Tax=Nocardioides phosphati TaxID=1867775 RepID=A0ABQ2N9B3_9ACTN|nr:hypothetical protein [Nocardioides phosphati]GGO88166.1 hypothetical protein GCM10011584_14490 [Nocardioides phosphati]